MTQRGLKPEIGQHLLIDQEAMNWVVEAIPHGHVILEIGAGPGLLTKHLIQKAKRVVAVEIDPEFQPELSLLKNDNSNLQIIIANALDCLRERDFKKLFGDRGKVWVAGNIPYHITEPLMARIIRLPISGATFLTGARFANEVSALSNSDHFGKLTLLVNTFFNVDIVHHINRECFSPPPRTNSAIVVLKPKPEKEFLSHPNLYVFSELFLSSHRGTLIKNLLRETFIKYNEYQKTGEVRLSGKPSMTKNEAREMLGKLEIPAELLTKSIEQLNNSEFRLLSERLRILQV